MSVILSAMMADSGLSFDHPGPSNGIVPIFNTKSHFLKQTVPLSHIMKLIPTVFIRIEAAPRIVAALE